MMWKKTGCLIAGLIMTFSFKLQAQYQPERIGKKAEQLYEAALNKASDGRYREAIAQLQEAVKMEPRFADALLSIGGIYGEMKQYAEAVTAYERAREIDSVYFKDYTLPYSINLAGMGAFDKAYREAAVFLSIPDLNPSSRKAGEYRLQTYAFAMQQAKDSTMASYRFEPKNLGEGINSAVSEYFPALTIDGSRLLYTRRVGNLNEDFYESRNENGKWQRSTSLTGDINTPQNEGAQNISQDGEWLIFTGCNFPDGAGSCDLYISYYTGSGWSTPENLGPTINTAAWESAPSLSPDKQNLYFASNRPGGFGQSDIYISSRLPDGNWTKPRNAGPSINTAGNESTPFLHADNRSLYFTSDGHPGYGGDDLFVARKDTGGRWNRPVNLGYPINTIENEGSMVVAADGKTAYYASDRSDSRGGLDLYSFELREDIRPARTLWVKGKVYDAATEKGLPSAVELTDLGSQEVLSRVQTDETGNYLITLPVGKDYAFNVNRKGYLLYSENFTLTQPTSDSTFRIDIPLQPIRPDAAVILKNIFFDVNRYELKPESYAELDKVVKLLNENPELNIVISGHTDNTGSSAGNLTLSNNRAKSVVSHLVSRGIDAARLTARGLGDSQPIDGNNTEAGRANNRRTEMRVRLP